MNSEDLLQKLEQLDEDETFRAAMSNAGSPAEAVKILAEYGVENSEQELLDLSAGTAAEGELTETFLEDVSGGNIIRALKWLYQKYHNPSRYSCGGGGSW